MTEYPYTVEELQSAYTSQKQQIQQLQKEKEEKKLQLSYANGRNRMLEIEYSNLKQTIDKVREFLPHFDVIQQSYDMIFDEEGVKKVEELKQLLLKSQEEITQ